MIDHAGIVATLELVESTVRSQGGAAQVTYHGVLGGPDVSVIVHKRVELVARVVGGKTQLAAFAETADAAATALAALDGLANASTYRASTHDRVIEAFRSALIATRDRWLALDRELPLAALSDLVREHPSLHVLNGHTIDLETGGLRPAYAAVRRGREPLFVWWSPALGFPVPISAKRETSAFDWLGGLDCGLPCELIQCIDLISLPDCDLDCDPGCL